MRISTKEWIAFILAAILCLGLWYKFGYPQLAFVDLSVGKQKALSEAETFLDSLGLDTQEYSRAIVFNADHSADRYLQKTLGLESEEKFIKRHDYELFSWKIRFFKELQKEEYIIEVSPKTGEILNFMHLVEDIEPRQSISKENARELAERFLKTTYELDLDKYDFHEERIKRYEQRTDYSFSWERKGVYIPWQKDQGGAKLLTAAIISGKEIRGFYKNRLDTPEKFQRYIENQFVFGAYLSSLSFILLLVLIAWSVFFVTKRKHTFVIRFSKKWYIYLAIFFIIINIIFIFNNIQNIIIEYPTSSRLIMVIGLYLVKFIISFIFFSFLIIMPGLAGESLRNEVMGSNKYASFSHYIKSTFYSRSMARSIMFGYLLFFVFLGIQAILFNLGHIYFGVWKERIKLVHFSSAYLPLLSVFIIGSRAGISEEIIYRLFGINWAKKYLKNTILAVVFISLIWGFSHSEYPIYPVWFRGIEVSVMGLIFGFLFIKYGIIPVIVAHYLFDVFWGVANYILGNSPVLLFAGSIAILLLPLGFAAACYFVNKSEKEKEIKMLLDTIEKYNLNILITFVSDRKSQGVSSALIRKELLSHNWDEILVDLAVNQVFKK